MIQNNMFEKSARSYHIQVYFEHLIKNVMIYKKKCTNRYFYLFFQYLIHFYEK
jgi:hypothetical protein